jgi:hypothetical protein
MADTMRLQGIGLVKGTPAGEVKPGMRLMWNYGSTYDVVSVEQIAPQTVLIHERSTESGEIYARKCRIGRLVAAYWPKSR